MATSIATLSKASCVSCRSRFTRPRLIARSPVCRLTVAKAQNQNADAESRCDLAGVSPLAYAGFAALAPLLNASSAFADEAEAAAAATAGPGGFGPGEAVLLLTPVAVYALFNVYRDRINPQAKFLDYIYIMAFLAIVANLVSIVVFKTRFF